MSQQNRVGKVARGIVQIMAATDADGQNWSDLDRDEQKAMLAVADGIVKISDAILKPHVTRLGRILRGEE